ncbi:menaquinone biosynthesis decarboxylase [Desulfosudis oleivorans]|uniref:UbiD family decarboxylase n=1 Tax=Desulfosudis oleivorans (strain DSM 6200 / JCM 39069 / Hxd3) TaxID=96561 RepID=A9A096_DESOH|nr:menaquinone biosynthesis decarboxylase [Desulfosudis oleivorans]ABW69015.1 UbiD family decarboxylase [Desulfosudis oleivorans Hxd3]
MFNCLQEFITALDRAGELMRVKQEVSPHLEISRLTDEQSKSPGGGKALFFEKVKGSRFPVATNIFGSYRRIHMALGVKNLDELGDRVRQYTEMDPPKSLRQAASLVPRALQLASFFPRSWGSRTPPCQEVVHTGDDVDLSKIPVLQCWPKDGGPFITLPVVFTQSLVTGRRNVGMYRLQVFDRNTTGMHWHIHKDGSHYFNEYVAAGKPMPVAVAIGTDPATTYAATAPLPRGIDEMILAGFIRKQPVKMAKCVTVDLEVPALAEFVLEGYVNPGETRIEGPFGDHTGYYSLADHYPVFHVTAITHRKNPVYSATLVGPPPMEDCYLAKATERLFLPMLQAVMPEILDYWLPWEGVFHNIVIVSIDKEFPGHAYKLINGLWGQGQMSFCKAIVVVDKNVNPQDGAAVAKRLLTHLDIDTDIVVTKGVLDVLDHSAPDALFGGKIGIDLCDRFTGEPDRKSKGPAPPLPLDMEALLRSGLPECIACRDPFDGLPGLKDAVVNRIVVLQIDKQRPADQMAETLFEIQQLDMVRVFVLFDRSVDILNNGLMLWKVFNNVSPDRDMVIKKGRMVIDACRKGPVDGHTREWPDELTFDI